MDLWSFIYLGGRVLKKWTRDLKSTPLPSKLRQDLKRAPDLWKRQWASKSVTSILKSQKIIFLSLHPLNTLAIKNLTFIYLCKKSLKPQPSNRYHLNRHPRSQIINLTPPNHPHPPLKTTTKSTHTRKSGRTYPNFRIFDFLLDLAKPPPYQTYHSKYTLDYLFSYTSKKAHTHSPINILTFCSIYN